MESVLDSVLLGRPPSPAEPVTVTGRAVLLALAGVRPRRAGPGLGRRCSAGWRWSCSSSSVDLALAVPPARARAAPRAPGLGAAGRADVDDRGRRHQPDAGAGCEPWSATPGSPRPGPPHPAAARRARRGAAPRRDHGLVPTRRGRPVEPGPGRAQPRPARRRRPAAQPRPAGAAARAAAVPLPPAPAEPAGPAARDRRPVRGAAARARARSSTPCASTSTATTSARSTGGPPHVARRSSCGPGGPSATAA